MYKKLLLIGVVLFVMLGYYYFVAPVVTFEHIKQYQEVWQQYVKDHYFLSVTLYLIAYTGVAALALPIAALMTLVGGSLFGVWCGALYAVVGATTGATLSFLMVRYLIGEQVQQKYADQLATVTTELKKQGAFYLLSLRLFAVMPFFLVNILAGLSSIDVVTFMGTTSIGIIPGALVYSYAGQSLASIESMQDILSPQISIAFVLLGLLALLPVLVNKLRERS